MLCCHGSKDQLDSKTFMPQTVPAYGATAVFNYLRVTYPAYTYKEATLNPKNPRNRAVDWEADIIQGFSNHPDQKELTGERDTPSGRAVFVARPIVAKQDCLSCHGTPSQAPAALIKKYGSDNGFGWQLADTVGAQIVSLPVSVLLGIADHDFKTLMVSLASVSVATLVLLNIGLAFIVIRPIARLSRRADEISKGNSNVPELRVDGCDEVSQLARSFNRMHLSLAKAIQLLESR
jgi:protein-histidine pros-kinase